MGNFHEENKIMKRQSVYGNINTHLLSEDYHDEILDHISSHDSYNSTEKVEDENYHSRTRFSRRCSNFGSTGWGGGGNSYLVWTSANMDGSGYPRVVATHGKLGPGGGAYPDRFLGWTATWGERVADGLSLIQGEWLVQGNWTGRSNLKYCRGPPPSSKSASVAAWL